MELMNIAYLQKSVEETRLTTRTLLTGVTIHYPIIIDTFLKLPYYFGDTLSNETSEGACQAVFGDHYIQLPYTIWSLHDQYEKGFYLEAIILERHLLELLIQIRYFHKYPQLYQDHLTSKSRKTRVTFKTMFEEFAPGFYHNHYGRFLSSFAHGSITKSIFRIPRNSPSKSRVILGCEFNIENATAIINSVSFIIFGFLSLFPVIYPNNTLSENPELLITYNEEVHWLSLYMQEHEKINPKSKEWCKQMRGINGS